MAERITIARPYAKAIFNLAQSEQRLADWSQILQTGAQVVGDARVQKLLGDPRITAAQLGQLIASVSPVPLDAQGQNLFSTLAANRRLGLLPEIAERYEALRAEAEKTQDVTVASATELSAEQQQRFAAALSRRLERQVRLHAELDPTLVGGAVLQANDLVIDGSLRSALAALALLVAS
ncbi:MAG TPA: F0F1 ATP synthase subunit delta [Steroidobacteraceae bacterium]|nr:F0F1 ATP synthase subunit delta [Steroidobacteraceae bacterium]